MISLFLAVWKRFYSCLILITRMPSSVSDYQPISIQCELAKSLEHFVHTEICHHLMKNDLLDLTNMALQTIASLRLSY